MAAAGVATILPVSINGLGVVEGAFVGSALALDVPYEPALIVAILLRVLLVPYALLFGLIYAFEPARGLSAFVDHNRPPSGRMPKAGSRTPRKDPARRA